MISWFILMSSSRNIWHISFYLQGFPICFFMHVRTSLATFTLAPRMNDFSIYGDLMGILDVYSVVIKYKKRVLNRSKENMWKSNADKFIINKYHSEQRRRRKVNIVHELCCLPYIDHMNNNVSAGLAMLRSKETFIWLKLTSPLPHNAFAVSLPTEIEVSTNGP